MRKIYDKLKETGDAAMPHKFPGLDGAKGVLVLLVVLTHCLPQSMILYFMYFFHMPLFMAISGFLVKTSTFQNGYSGYLKRMWGRLIIPWIIAWFIFLPFKMNFNYSIDQFNLSDLIYPYYHLWYIPSYLIGSFLCYSIIRWKVPYWLLLLLTGIFCVFWYNIYRDNHVPVENLPLYWLGEKRLFSYLFFFILGFTLRNRLIPETWKFNLNLILALLVIAFSSIFFLVWKHVTSWAIVWPYMVFNSSLIILVMVFIAPNDWTKNKAVLYVNQNSLGVYLYHPLLQSIIYRFILNDPQQKNISNLGAVIVFICVMIGTLILIRILRIWGVTDRYMLGNIKR